jgi:serralysin
LNGDGLIGFPVVSGTTIEAFGTTKLVQAGSRFYLQSVSDGSGPDLKYNGASVVAGQFGWWTPIGAEQTSTGYQVVLKDGAVDSFVVWITDNSGNYLTNLAPATGSSPAMTSLEVSFQQDLNGDGAIGAASASGTIIEALGSTKLVLLSNNFYLQDISSASGPILKYNATAVVAGQFGAWTPIGAEQMSAGYQVVLKNGSADSYVVWMTDVNGNYVANLAPASGSSATITSLEATFNQDLNGDGSIGVASTSGTTIESLGSTKLVLFSNNYYLENISGGSGPTLKYSGAAVVAGQFGVWAPIGTEQTSGGYQVVMKNGSADSYVVWVTDNNGNYLTNGAPASGSSPTITSLEDKFQQDLNGDGVISVSSTVAPSQNSPVSTSQVVLGAPDSYGAFQFKPALGLQIGEVASGHMEASAPVDSNPTHLAVNVLADWLTSSHGANVYQAFGAAPTDHEGAAVPSLEQLALHAGFVIVH